MKQIFCSLFFVICSLLSACGERPLARANLTCGEFDVRVAVYADRLDSVINGQHVPMTHVISADGAKYEGISGNVTLSLWNKGESWLMLINDERGIDCKVNSE